MLLRLLEYLFLFAVIWLGLTQVVWPLWHGRPMWPLFGRRGKAERTLGDLEERADIRDIYKRTKKL